MKRPSRRIVTLSFRPAREEKSDDPVGRLLGRLVAFVTILGIPTGLYGYYAGENAKRVATTFEFYKEFKGEALQKHYQLLILRSDEKAEAIDGTMKTYRDNVPERDRRVLEIIQTSIAGTDEMKAMATVLSFFDGLVACVQSRLCNNNATVALFKLPAAEFASAYGPYVLSVREKYSNPKYGTGLFQTRAMETTWSVF